MAKIRMIVIEGEMEVDDVRRLAQAFSAGDAAFTSITLPGGVTGQAATLSKGEEQPRPRPVSLPAMGDSAPVSPAAPVVGHSVEGTVSGGGFQLVHPQSITVHAPPADSGVKVSITAAVQEAQPTASYTAPVTVPAGVLKVFPEAVPEAHLLEQARSPETLIEDLMACKRLVGVLERLKQEGHHELPALIAECKKYRDQIPMLQRLGDGLEDRITRTFEGMR